MTVTKIWHVDVLRQFSNMMFGADWTLYACVTTTSLFMPLPNVTFGADWTLVIVFSRVLFLSNFLVIVKRARCIYYEWI